MVRGEVGGGGAGSEVGGAQTSWGQLVEGEVHER